MTAVNAVAVTRSAHHKHNSAISTERDTRWWNQAACADLDPTLFETFDDRADPEALATCSRCPVRDACLADALTENAHTWGVRGGLTPDQRAALKRRRTQTPATPTPNRKDPA